MRTVPICLPEAFHARQAARYSARFLERMSASPEAMASLMAACLRKNRLLRRMMRRQPAKTLAMLPNIIFFNTIASFSSRLLSSLRSPRWKVHSLKCARRDLSLRWRSHFMILSQMTNARLRTPAEVFAWRNSLCVRKNFDTVASSCHALMPCLQNLFRPLPMICFTLSMV